MDNNCVEFSIIVPVYNCEKFLNKMINSILNQTYKNFEIILVNDGSTDESLIICERFSSEYENIKVINKKNTGVSDTRNVGIKNSNGKYILFMDADDYVEETYLEHMDLIIQKYDYNIDLINTGIYTEVTKNGKCFLDEIKYKTMYYSNQEEIRKDLINLWDTHMLYNPVNKVYSKKIIDENDLKFPDLYFGEDMDFNMSYVKCINTFYNLDKCFYHYIREREGSATEKYDENLFSIREKEYLKFNKYFEDNDIAFENYIEFSSRRFIERVVGCAENVCRSNMRVKEKKQHINKMINNENVRFALKYANVKSKKMKILVFPIKVNSTNLLFLMSNLVFYVKKVNPALFYKLKNRR